jgi:hypothetical protein
MAKRKQEKKSKEKEEAKVHPDLKGFSIEVDEFGNVRMNRSTEELSQFLKEHLPQEEGKEGKQEES